MGDVEEHGDICGGVADDCGVHEDQFPYIGKCCSKSSYISGVAYKKTCSYCSIWVSPPHGADLDITAIFGCSHYGYDKRIKE